MGSWPNLLVTLPISAFLELIRLASAWLLSHALLGYYLRTLLLLSAGWCCLGLFHLHYKASSWAGWRFPWTQLFEDWQHYNPKSQKCFENCMATWMVVTHLRWSKLSHPSAEDSIVSQTSALDFLLFSVFISKFISRLKTSYFDSYKPFFQSGSLVYTV